MVGKKNVQYSLQFPNLIFLQFSKKDSNKAVGMQYSLLCSEMDSLLKLCNDIAVL